MIALWISIVGWFVGLIIECLAGSVVSFLNNYFFSCITGCTIGLMAGCLNGCFIICFDGSVVDGWFVKSSVGSNSNVVSSTSFVGGILENGGGGNSLLD